MHNSERYPYLTCIDSQALLAQCEKKEIKDGLSVLTQYLHNRKYLSPAGLNEALSFMAEEVLDKEGCGKLALKDDHLELFFKKICWQSLTTIVNSTDSGCTRSLTGGWGTGKAVNFLLLYD